MDKKKQMVEIWGDVVEIKSLIIAIIVSIVSTMGFYAIAPSDDKTKQLFFGLIGAVIGFTISAIFIKPKRIIVIEEKIEE
ncbi:hypothetical protein [Tissierella creatinophila]|uniref:Uncharacterized protein n=1 Tax=Tissierella creatinophila DSM 6911 TaxID=1123403 RepID=A0A1U7M8G0_TISCR|nr:hypothetical protein [Tissierella creatinophila]OLS03613.1 hypothetical protein TICRE_03070 [Tissierella creatinophila DSM 6911]